MEDIEMLESPSNEENNNQNNEIEVTYKEMSPLQMVLGRFFRSKLSIVGLVMIVFLFAFSFLGPALYRGIYTSHFADSEKGVPHSMDEHVDETRTKYEVTDNITYHFGSFIQSFTAEIISV